MCDALGNLDNTIIVMNLTGEITQPGQSKFHRIKLDPYRSYMIEAIGQVGEDMLGVEEHPNLTLSNPDIPAIWNARATSKWSTYGDRNDGDQPKNVIRRFLDSSYRTYKVEVNSGQQAGPAPTSSRSGSTTSAAWTRTTTPTTNGPGAHWATPRAPTYPLESADVRSC